MTREVFWNIDLHWLFYGASALIIVGFAIGLYRNALVWQQGWKRDRPISIRASLSRTLLIGALNRRVFTGDPIAGLMHLSIMWGFIVLFLGTVLLTVHNDVVPFLFGTRYLVYSLVLDIAGLVMILGVLVALVRRYVIRVRPMPNLMDDALILIVMLIIGVTGFLIEGLRLAALRPADYDWSPIGALFAMGLNGSGVTVWHRWLWWFHAAASLSLIVYIPLSKLFHMIAAPANIYFSAEKPVLTLEERERLTGDFAATDLLSFDACTRCNRCENACPAFAAGEPLSPRAFVLAVRGYAKRKHGLRGRWNRASGDRAELRVGDVLGKDEAWWCTTCKACVEQCPVLIRPMEIIGETRQKLMDDGRKVPPSIRDMLRTMAKHNNPWESVSGAKRSAWRRTLGCKDFSQGDVAEVCYWISCVASNDERNQAVARALVAVLRAAGVDFAHLGKDETCCGEFVKGLGEVGLFETIVEQNCTLFADLGISRLVTTSPHCYHTMKHDYPELSAKLHLPKAASIVPKHHAELLDELITGGRLRLTRRLGKRVTFHDPCYLGRRNGVYEQPRRVLRAMPGVELVEMAHSRQNSFCCGGGGGRMWFESTAEQRMAELRVREAAQTSAEVIVTACPFCMSNLDDAVKTAGYEAVMEVRDLAELVALAAELDTVGEEVTT